MIRVFPRKNKWTPADDLSFIGDPPLFRPPEQPVKISITFTWDMSEGWRLFRAWSQYYSDVQIGGPAFADPGGDFIPGRFIKSGVTITSRGCFRQCAWCVVPQREGRIRELPINDGWIVQDNNLLACSRTHIEAVFAMLRRQKKSAIFSGGLDARLLQPWHRELIDSIKIKELWFACDTAADLPALEKANKLLDGIQQRKKRCYVLIGYGQEDISQAENRLKKVYELGFYPFSQLYRAQTNTSWYSDEWDQLNRFWSRPGLYRHKNIEKVN